LPPDLPYHANVGAGYQAFGYSVEEDLLLRDAFLLLVKAQKEFEKLDNKIKGAEKEKQPMEKLFEIYNQLAENVATYSRLCVLSFYAFIECLVNSIGEDFLARNHGITLEEKDIENLKGYKKSEKNKDIYFGVLTRMEKIPGIIRGDKTYKLLLSDPAQIAEPFKSFFGSLKCIRDSTMHHAKYKDDILRNPDDWAKIADDACDTCLGVAGQFWLACYPSKSLPAYLEGLDKAKYMDSAEKRLDSEKTCNDRG